MGPFFTICGVTFFVVSVYGWLSLEVVAAFDVKMYYFFDKFSDFQKLAFPVSGRMVSTTGGTRGFLYSMFKNVRYCI